MSNFLKRSSLLCEKIICNLFALILLMVQRFLSPILLIRLSYFDSMRIGNLYSHYWTDCQSKEKKKDTLFTIDLFFSSKIIANQKWLSLFRTKYNIFCYNRLFATFYNLLSKLPNKQKYIYSTLTRTDIYTNKKVIDNIILKKEPYFLLTKTDLTQGESHLLQMGVPKDTPFICFHNRDSAYLDQSQPGKDWTYHDYRDSSIYNYLHAVDFLVDEGYYAIRAGAIVKEKLKPTNKKIIEYANSSFRTDFMDIYLGARCSLFLCSDTGMSIIPELFDVPIVYVNWVPIASMSNWVKYGVYIPKRFYSNRLKRELTFREIMSDPILSDLPSTQYLTENEIILTENTPDEILKVVQETLKRIRNEWADTPEMEILQKKFWSLEHTVKFRSVNFNISSTYLFDNQHLLMDPA